MFRTGLIIIMILLSWQQGASQKTLVFGRITEVQSGNPIAFANIAFKGTLIGASSDELGNYLLETTESHTRLTFSAIGYRDTTITIRVHERQELKVALQPADYTLDEVIIKAGENPAFAILRQVIDRKKFNDPAVYNTYQYRSYNKAQFDLNNFSDKIKRNPLFKPFPFIWQYQDSMANGVRYLPFLFKENVRDHYYRKSPGAYREYVIADQKSQFFRGPKIEKFIEELYLNPEIYRNFVVILNKSFPSPVNDNFSRYYKYVLNDSLRYIDGLPCHHIRFYPKGASDVAFTGEMYIHDSTFAVKRMDLSFSIEANINFVRSFWIRLEYSQLADKNWFIDNITVLADFTVVENAPELTGFFGRRYSQYKNVIINQPVHDSVFTPVDEVVTVSGFEVRDDKFWNSERSDSLSDEEQNIFHLVDTIESNWKFKIIKNSFTTVGTGWAPFKRFEIGNIFSFYSYNNIEKSRVKVGFRSPYNSPYSLQPRGYLAYGTGDDTWKYMGELNWVFGREPGKNNLVGVHYQKDADQLGRSYYAIPLDHVLTYFLQVAPFDTRTLVENRSAYFERQWFYGLVTRLSVFEQKVSPFGNYHFREMINGQQKRVNEFTLGGFRLSGRFAYGEKHVRAKFYDSESKFFMLKYPAVSFEYSFANKNLLSSQFNYSRLNIRADHQQRLNRWGYLSYLVEAGKVWGVVPYPFLAIPFGNQAILADRASFNMMNYLEFASDEYVALHVEHHFEGLLLNKMPFNRILKLREILLFKMYAGRLSPENNQGRWLFPGRLYAIDEPYLEAGFGIENILKLGRIDFTWRLNYHNHPDVYRFLPKPSFQFRF